jgi:hypothetical protein
VPKRNESKAKRAEIRASGWVADWLTSRFWHATKRKGEGRRQKRIHFMDEEEFAKDVVRWEQGGFVVREMKHILQQNLRENKCVARGRCTKYGRTFVSPGDVWK